MAKFKESVILKFQTHIDADVEETQFSVGDEVEIMEEWSQWYLIKDESDHYYNVPKDKIEK